MSINVDLRRKQEGRGKCKSHTFSGIEARNLDDIVTLRPLELVHLLLGAQVPELAHVELRVPVGSWESVTRSMRITEERSDIAKEKRAHAMTGIDPSTNPNKRECVGVYVSPERQVCHGPAMRPQGLHTSPIRRKCSTPGNSALYLPQPFHTPTPRTKEQIDEPSNINSPGVQVLVKTIQPARKMASEITTG